MKENKKKGVTDKDRGTEEENEKGKMNKESETSEESRNNEWVSRDKR